MGEDVINAEQVEERKQQYEACLTFPVDVLIENLLDRLKNPVVIYDDEDDDSLIVFSNCTSKKSQEQILSALH